MRCGTLSLYESWGFPAQVPADRIPSHHLRIALQIVLITHTDTRNRRRPKLSDPA